MVAGVFVEEELVGFRVLYFYHSGDETNPLLCTGTSYRETDLLKEQAILRAVKTAMPLEGYKAYQSI